MLTRLYLSSTRFIVCLSFAASADDAHSAIKRAQEAKRLTSDVVSDLVMLALDESDQSFTREHSILMLGDLKAHDSIEPLLRILFTKGMLRSETGPLSAYPAAQALARMGSVIYRDVWGKVGADQSDQYLYVVAFTMVSIDGKSIATFRVREKLKTAEVNPLKNNLQRLLLILETPDLERPMRWPK